MNKDPDYDIFELLAFPILFVLYCLIRTVLAHIGFVFEGEPIDIVLWVHYSLGSFIGLITGIILYSELRTLK